MPAGRQVLATLRCREFIIIRDPIIKKKMRQASVNQKFVEDASLVIEVIQLAFIGLSIAIIIYESKMKKELSGKTASG
jgi:hypothetical protein